MICRYRTYEDLVRSVAAVLARKHILNKEYRYMQEILTTYSFNLYVDENIYMVMSRVKILPPKIRSSLAQYTAHENCTCLECGYIGLMGVHEGKTITRVKLIVFGVSFIIAVIAWNVTFPSARFSFWWILIPALVTGLFARYEPKFLHCPNCDTDLTRT